MVTELGKTVVLLALLCIASRIGVVNGKRSIPSQGKELEVEKKLKSLNKPFIKSIKSGDGDIIDCVDIKKQPAFDHPLMKNHVIKKFPSIPTMGAISPVPPRLNSSMPFSQVWRRSGSCPAGTIPIRRVLKYHLLNCSSLARYGMKNSGMVMKHGFLIHGHTFALGLENNHSVVVLHIGGFNFLGAKAYINVWNPPVEADDEYTTGQIWLKNGPVDNSDTIEVGWMVNPSVYGDRQTRLFIYWTADSGKSTGCFDLLCSGFIQMNRDVVLGGTITPMSSFHGLQSYISLEVFKDPKQDAWWLTFNTNIVIGYWPSKIFNHMQNTAGTLQWGGDVYSPRMHTGGTATGMGSSHFAFEHWSMASFIAQPRMMTTSLAYEYPKSATVVATEMKCYAGEIYSEGSGEEPLFYFGGPGLNMFCP
ncbi:uncharacterized protein LOC120280385 [Dioscorea cayenensis subsp. rotundata]|uniref:Uncharacterized protein LOC120280385 n=1 Tax=Dioscorea cayennensis subsp. rotundata TaxID=55577 RepID=A0AB40CYN0_DIOCR|nr:uncharacterized protein LOC120280385 [Dioscorea cayenensis subsp. rotundata]